MKNAYLIMAHDNFYNLKVLLELLDDARNDIYIHMDKRTLNWDPDEWSHIMHNAKIHFVKRGKVYWGTYSQIEALKNLMHESVTTYHDYYHVLTGADLPIKSQDEIDNFFLKHKGKEFVGFASTYNKEVIHQKNYFIKFFRSKNKFLALWARRLRKLFINIQLFFNIDTMKTFNMEIKKGTDWYSITHDAVKLLLLNEPEFKKYFYKAIHPGEFFAQTILFNSHFKENIYSFENENIGCQRYIDWEGTAPTFTFRSSDMVSLMKSDLMFARKFHESIDKKVIDSIYYKFKIKSTK